MTKNCKSCKVNVRAKYSPMTIPGGLNKYQRAALHAKAKRYRNRQQLLSVKTVKSIAKQAVTKSPEVKLKNYAAYGTAAAADKVVMHPASAHVLTKCLLNTTDLNIGADQGQRISQRIFFKGINLAMAIDAPTRKNVHPEHGQNTSTFRAGEWTEVHVKVVGIRSCGDPQAAPPDDSAEIADDRFVFQRDLNMTSVADLKPTTVFHRKFILKPKLIEGRDTSVPQSLLSQCIPEQRWLKTYIPINKHITFTGVNDGHWKTNYFLWVYAYGSNQYVPENTAYWGGSAEYCPRINYAYTAYYTDL